MYGGGGKWGGGQWLAHDTFDKGGTTYTFWGDRNADSW